jgi:hypothetical protein
MCQDYTDVVPILRRYYNLRIQRTLPENQVCGYGPRNSFDPARHISNLKFDPQTSKSIIIQLSVGVNVGQSGRGLCGWTGEL